jgi:hypothetical protein
MPGARSTHPVSTYAVKSFSTSKNSIPDRCLHVGNVDRAAFAATTLYLTMTAETHATSNNEMCLTPRDLRNGSRTVSNRAKSLNRIP